MRTLVQRTSPDRRGAAAGPQRRRPSCAEAEAAVPTLLTFEAAHQCVTTREIRKPGVSMMTSRLLGALRHDPMTRSEFLSRTGTSGTTAR